MSWTSYVEKSGSGTGVIIDKCTEHGLARPEFDPTSGFFKTIIWRTGSNAAKGLVAGASRGLVKGPSQGAQSRGPVVAQSNGPVVAQSWPSQGAQSRDSVGGASRGLVAGGSQGLVKVLIALSGAGTPLSSTAVANAMGKERANSYIKRLLSSLLDDGLIETTGERKRGARLQKYRLTAKGRKLVASFKQKGGRK